LSAAGAAPHSLELLGQFRSGGGGAEPFGFERTATLQFVDALQPFIGGLSISRAPQQVSTSSSWKQLLFQGPRRIFTLPGAALQAERPSPGWLGSAPRRSFPIPGRSAGPPRKGGRGIFIAEVSRPLTAFPAWLLFLVNRNNKSNIRFRNTPNVLLPIGCHGFPNLVSLSIIS
jgi:hypothetical protein